MHLALEDFSVETDLDDLGMFPMGAAAGGGGGGQDQSAGGGGGAMGGGGGPFGFIAQIAQADQESARAALEVQARPREAIVDAIVTGRRERSAARNRSRMSARTGQDLTTFGSFALGAALIGVVAVTALIKVSK